MSEEPNNVTPALSFDRAWRDLKEGFIGEMSGFLRDAYEELRVRPALDFETLYGRLKYFDSEKRRLEKETGTLVDRIQFPSAADLSGEWSKKELIEADSENPLVQDFVYGYSPKEILMQLRRERNFMNPERFNEKIEECEEAAPSLGYLLIPQYGPAGWAVTGGGVGAALGALVIATDPNTLKLVDFTAQDMGIAAAVGAITCGLGGFLLYNVSEFASEPKMYFSRWTDRFMLQELEYLRKEIDADK